MARRFVLFYYWLSQFERRVFSCGTLLDLCNARHFAHFYVVFDRRAIYQYNNARSDGFNLWNLE